MYNKVDKRIRQEMLETERPLPSSYEDRIENVLRDLPESKGRSRRLFRPRVAILICVCLVFGATGVAATVRTYLHRLESMSQTQIEEVNSKTQTSQKDADSFSRELTIAERERMNALRVQYEEKGKLPQSELKQVDHVSEVNTAEFCYCYENSMVYLPEGMLSEEQLLQLVDFQYVRDYAVQKAQEKENTKDSAGLAKLSGEEAKKAAADFIKKLYGMELEKEEVAVEFHKKQEGVEPYYTVIFSKDEKQQVVVDIHSDTGDLMNLSLEGDKSSNDIKIEEKKYVDYGKEVEKMAGYLMPQSDIKTLQLSYLHLKKDLLLNGDVKYYVVDKDGEGYTFQYNAGTDKVDKILSLGDFKTQIKNEKEEDSNYYEEKQIYRKRITLKSGNN